MLRTTILVLMLILSSALTAQIKLPALSPAATTSQKIGLTTADLSYSRPSLRGRALFGRSGVLVFDEKWRTGANATTKIAFSNDVQINGQLLKKGSYALLSTPHENSWTFHFYPYEKLSYTKFMDKTPILEVTVPIQKTDYLVETLSLHFEAIDLATADLVLQWGEYKVVLPVKLEEHEDILANINKVLDGPSAFNYYQAALYLHETKTDLPLALQYVQEATKSEKALFFQVYREALILQDLGRKDEAVEVAKRSLELSQKAGNADFVRLSQRIIKGK